jgi:GNAT superfamily N-acetyltransferase
MDIRPISVWQARTIRQEVLRPGLPASDSVYPADDSPLSVHLGAFEGERLVGVASFFPEACPQFEARAWRLRGMAVVEAARNRGLGSRLLAQGIAHSIDAGVDIVWCNGRTSARSFYERHGFAAMGTEFSIRPSGPHYLFVLHVPALPRAE